jgi:hypothetical protein
MGTRRVLQKISNTGMPGAASRSARIASSAIRALFWPPRAPIGTLGLPLRFMVMPPAPCAALTAG